KGDGGNTAHTGNTATDPRSKDDEKRDNPPAVCFKITGHCVAGTQAHSGRSGATSPPQDGTSRRPPLNLTPPEVRPVVPEDELKEPLPSDEQMTETQEAQTVRVQGDPQAPDVPGGFAALWWALIHPSQAWRILAPAE